MPAPPPRLVLDGVPRIHFYDGGGPACPEDIGFPSVMRALTEYFGETDFGCRSCRASTPGCKITCSYAFFMGVSGIASFLAWKPGWSGNNADITMMSANPEAPFARAFQAAGYEYTYAAGGASADLRAHIVASIARGRPVVAFGPVGPPEGSLITGYDDGGQTLIGWSLFQSMPPFNSGLQFEPSGQYRKQGWQQSAPSFPCIFVGEKTERPPLKAIYRQALQWIWDVAHAPARGDQPLGLAAYTAWAEDVLRAQDPASDEATWRRRHEEHDFLVFMVAETRWYGSLFLIQASDGDLAHYSAVDQLLHAAACYAKEHDLMWQLWGLAGGNGNPEGFRYLADPAVRKKMAAVILEAREQEVQAIQHIERALAKG